MGRTKVYDFESDEARRAFYRDRWKLNQKPKEKEDYKRLAKWRGNDSNASMKTKRERKQFLEQIREQNRKRLEDIFNDKELLEKINSSSNDDYVLKKARQERKKKNPGVWVKQSDVEKAEKIIWGGMSGEVFEEDPKIEFTNPYEE